MPAAADTARINSRTSIIRARAEKAAAALVWFTAFFVSCWPPALAGPTPARNEGVILLHGLARSAASLDQMESALARAGYRVVNVDYPSRTAAIADLSEKAIGGALHDPRLAECTTVHFVTHSLGGILVRDYVARHPIPRLGRVVMLGPPNGGSEVVDRLRDWTLFEKVNGPAGQQLGTDAKSVPRQLGPVTFELGVIAGNRSINWINSTMIDGPDDGKVSVEHTKVAGMKDHLVLPVTHPLMMRDDAVIAACLRFLTTGWFAANPSTTDQTAQRLLR